MPIKRTDRVGALLQAAISELLLRDVKDPRVGLVTVTGVELSADLKHARVFVSTLGDASTRERSMQGLASARAYVQSHVGKRLGLRFTPELRFVLDPSLETADRLERLLRTTHRADDREAEDAPPPEVPAGRGGRERPR
jgi:ribosome-binding factor A